MMAIFNLAQEPWGKSMPNRITNKKYGTVSADGQKEMGGPYFVQGFIDGTPPLNTIAETLGYDTEVTSGRVVVTVKPNGTHLSPAGTAHGGLAATLFDWCMSLAIRSTLEKGVSQTTVEFKITLVRPITAVTSLMKAAGVILNCGRRIGMTEGRITDHKGRLLAHGTTTCPIFQS